ncbi:hypothetical protein Tco_0620365, partial [Tanacetum coccineum]
MTTFSSALTQLRTPFVLAGGISLTFFIPSFILWDSCVGNTIPIPLAVWNLMAQWMVETTIPIFCIVVLPSNILYDESDLTMIKLRVSLLAKRGVAYRDFQRNLSTRLGFFPKNPIKGTFESILDALMEGFNFMK